MKCDLCESEAVVFSLKAGQVGLIPVSLCKDHAPKSKKGAKDTAGKPRYSLLPRKGCEAVIAVREFGTAKYHGDSENWRKVPQREWAEACLRHVFKWLDGEENDEESGLSHLAHAATSMLLACSVKHAEK
jgi:hypothetical protein